MTLTVGLGALVQGGPQLVEVAAGDLLGLAVLADEPFLGSGWTDGDQLLELTRLEGRDQLDRGGGMAVVVLSAGGDVEQGAQHVALAVAGGGTEGLHRVLAAAGIRRQQHAGLLAMAVLVHQHAGDLDAALLGLDPEAHREAVLLHDGAHGVDDVLQGGVGAVVALASLGDARQLRLHGRHGRAVGHQCLAIEHALLHLQQAFHLVDVDLGIEGGPLDHLDDRGALLVVMGDGCLTVGIGVDGSGHGDLLTGSG